MTEQQSHNPYAAALEAHAQGLAAASLRGAASHAAANPGDALALTIELDRLRAENDALRNTKPKSRTSLTDIMSWSEQRAVWTMRMANMCNGCCFIGGAVGSFALVGNTGNGQTAPQSYERVVLALYMM